MLRCLLALIGILVGGQSIADGRVVALSVTADRPTCLYKCGETARMSVTVTDRLTGEKVKAGRFTVTLNNCGSKTVLEKEVDLAEGNPFVVSGTLADPGFMQLRIRPLTAGIRVAPNAGQIDYAWGVAFSPERIRPVMENPSDFDRFWQDARKKLDRTVPVDPKMEEIPSLSTSAYRVFGFSVASYGRRVYGQISIPRNAKGKKLPVWTFVPGAGCADWSNRLVIYNPSEVNVLLTVFPWAPDWTDNGKATLERFRALEKSYKDKYGVNGYGFAGLSVSREEYFFYPVFLGMARALDWIASLPQVDARRIRYYGSSQAGGLGIALSALFGKFAGAACMVPAFCDMAAEEAGRKSDWPPVSCQPAASRMVARRHAPYFDACNFARRVRTPILFEVGAADVGNSPHCGYAAYNVCPSTAKRMLIGIGQGHGVESRYRLEAKEWLMGF